MSPATSWMRTPALLTGRSGLLTWLFVVALSGFVRSDDSNVTRSTRWVQTTVIPAPEAVQAAAAEREFIYAIANSQIAKYERASGKRIAVSQGEALHLNSGFFWKGRLYCAHSNYPRTPEQSQIKLLDVDSMQLTTFHDFKDFGGSLTWVLRHDDHWWCNFAHYGDANGRTFLAKFDDDWREIGRWTYPATVVRELGRNSLSGGIWQNGELLVTGHDDPLGFRLKLPEQGTVLVDNGRQAVPFTGQGIAADPVTGGLVGINRARRQVVFAEARSSTLVRVLTYNIHHAEGVDGKLDLERIAGVIRSVEPDFVALQEVDRMATRSKSVDQPEELARMTKMHVVFGDNIPLQGGQYGNAMLSRFPVLRSKNHALPNIDAGEQRGVLEVDVALPGMPGKDASRLLVLATHFDHRKDDRERIASARRVNELLSVHPERPALLLGDLNDVPDSATLAELQLLWKRSNDRIAPTIPVGQPKHQIDYILFRPTDRWNVVETKVLDEAVASDHRAMLAVLELSDEIAVAPVGESPRK